MPPRGSDRGRARPVRLAPPRVIVGLDFGTTFSGFAYAHNIASPTGPSKIPNAPRIFIEWPEQKMATDTIYCKTATSLYYLPQVNGQWQLKNWGWPAKIRHAKALDKLEYVAFVERNVASLSVGESQGTKYKEPSRNSLSSVPICGDGVEGAFVISQRESGELLEHFKLLLCEDSTRDHVTLTHPLPEGLELERVISDFLAEIGQFALADIQKTFGSHMEMSDLQWVLTVPSIWDEKAKQRMKRCMERANLVQPRDRVDSNGGSRHELLLILEPEAGSIYCRSPEKWPEDMDPIYPGDQFVVLDAGGGTVDLVGQEEDEEGRTRELAPSVGNLCGGKFVDDEYVKLLYKRIPVLREYVADRPSCMIELMQQWFSKAKNSFSGEPQDSSVIDLATGLAAAWERHIEDHGLEEQNTDDILLSSQDLRRMFDPIVAKIIRLIRKQVAAVSGCKAILMVGGFSESKYLQKRVRDAFRDITIVKPIGAGGAVCVGATLYGLRPNLVASRIARKNYGIGMRLRSIQPNTSFFLAGIGPPFISHIEEDHFFIFVRKGEEVDVDSHVTHTAQPSHPGQDRVLIELFSSESSDVESTTDSRVKKEGQFLFLIPDTTLETEREIAVDMFFGRSSVEVTARSLNFRQGRHEDGSLSVNFEGEDVD